MSDEPRAFQTSKGIRSGAAKTRTADAAVRRAATARLAACTAGTGPRIPGSSAGQHTARKSLSQTPGRLDIWWLLAIELALARSVSCAPSQRSGCQHPSQRDVGANLNLI